MPALVVTAQPFGAFAAMRGMRSSKRRLGASAPGCEPWTSKNKREQPYSATPVVPGHASPNHALAHHAEPHLATLIDSTGGYSTGPDKMERCSPDDGLPNRYAGEALIPDASQRLGCCSVRAGLVYLMQWY